MNINTIDDIVSLLMRRDHISEQEARTEIDCCRAEINSVLCGDLDYIYYGLYDRVADIIYDWLGLEPDFIDIIIG